MFAVCKGAVCSVQCVGFRVKYVCSVQGWGCIGKTIEFLLPQLKALHSLTAKRGVCLGGENQLAVDRLTINLNPCFTKNETYVIIYHNLAKIKMKIVAYF